MSQRPSRVNTETFIKWHSLKDSAFWGKHCHFLKGTGWRVMQLFLAEFPLPVQALSSSPSVSCKRSVCCHSSGFACFPSVLLHTCPPSLQRDTAEWQCASNVMVAQGSRLVILTESKGWTSINLDCQSANNGKTKSQAEVKAVRENFWLQGNTEIIGIIKSSHFKTPTVRVLAVVSRVAVRKKKLSNWSFCSLKDATLCLA